VSEILSCLLGFLFTDGTVCGLKHFLGSGKNVIQPTRFHHIYGTRAFAENKIFLSSVFFRYWF
jgi:hypothetical protein